MTDQRDETRDSSMSETLEALDEVQPSVEQVLSGSEDLTKEDLLKPFLLLEKLKPLVKNLLEQNQKLEREVRQKNRLKVLGEMASCLAHEIRTPLADIHLNLEQLKEDLEVTDSDHQIKKIDSGLNKIQHLVDDILTYSKELDPIPAQFSWNRMIDMVLEELSVKVEKYDSRIERNCSDELPAVEGDQRQLSRAHKNVILNAIQAAGENGTVQVDTAPGEQVPIDGGESVSTVRTTIRDNGPGIAPEIQEKLFTPFYSKKTRGTGLGLAIASRIVKAHGGTISGTNREKSKGAIFEIQVPVAFSPPERSPMETVDQVQKNSPDPTDG